MFLLVFKLFVCRKKRSHFKRGKEDTYNQFDASVWNLKQHGSIVGNAGLPVGLTLQLLHELP